MPSVTPQLAGERRVTLEHLRAFVSIAENGGFQRASAQIHRSQSAITQSLQKLESILGCRLLKRSQGHIVGLTPDGERLLPSAREILARLDDVVGAIRRPELTGRIRLGIPDDFRIADLQQAISHSMMSNRQLRVEVISALSDHLLALVERQALDIAIYKHTVDDGDEAAEIAGRGAPLWREPLRWVGQRRLLFQEMKSLALVAFPQGCAYRHAARRALAQTAMPVFCAYQSASYENIRAAISAGLGIGVLPHSAVGQDHVILTPAEGFPPLPDVQLSITVNSAQPVCEQFADFLRRAASLALRQRRAGDAAWRRSVCIDRRPESQPGDPAD
ncbi:LysR family transcriptional regulator [Affinibrenneria salicis]|uniref:LysR family transcriptional regulator n=1 Tax=Affinibrenneria salicis TaxID=2590031 RepID=A0A5J5FQU0_9GAMM|nr:LysR family transcriptional regulator [Affinibrenneria salicis]KAA8995387.1 LysR family transcriptional regulator [Affinibrenneria salicis]